MITFIRVCRDATCRVSTPRRLRKAIAYWTIGLIVADVAIAVVYLVSIFLTGESPAIVNMDGARNIPSGLQAIQLFAIGAIALGFGLAHTKEFPYPSRKLSFVLAALLFYAGFDEVFKLHLGFRNLLPISGTGFWIGIYSSLICLLPIVFIRDFKVFWQCYRRETLIGLMGLVIFALGGFGAELFKHYLLQPLLANSLLWQRYDGLALFVEKFRVAVEELGELLGETVVLYAALRLSVRRWEERRERSRST